MARRSVYLILAMALSGIAAHAQQAPTAPSERNMYCSGIVTNQEPPRDTYVISGVESGHRIAWADHDLVFINRGSNQGVSVGDQFLVSRPVNDPLRVKWFDWQPGLLRAMGQTYADLGRLRVVSVHPDTSTAEVVYACDLIQRGDIVQPFAERPAPPYKPAGEFDPFAPPSGKPMATIVTTRDFGQQAGEGRVIYVNLGSEQGVRAGDYFRIFRYQGIRRETAYQTRGMAHRLWGFGAAPRPYSWDELPREILGEGIVLRTAPNASTVLVTLSLREIYVGDYVEVE